MASNEVSDILTQQKYNKAYYINNKERIFEYQTKMVDCEVCGSCVRKWNRSKHIKTKRHERYLRVGENIVKITLEKFRSNEIDEDNAASRILAFLNK